MSIRGGAAAPLNDPGGGGANGEPKESPRPHLAYLDGMRAAAAVFVVAHHCLLQTDLASRKLPLWLVPFAFGHYAVDLFIVLSGFCLMIPVVRANGELRGGALHFYRRRARRILPPYYGALAVSLLLIGTLIGEKTGTHWDISLPVTKTGLITHLLLVQDMFEATHAQINHAFWSISVEWRIYFLFPALVWCWRRFGGPVTASIGIGLSLALLSALRGGPIYVGEAGASPQYIGLFAMGMLGAGIAFGNDRTLTWLRTRMPWQALVLGGFAVIAGLSKFPLYHGGLLPFEYTDYVVGMWAIALLVATGASGPSWLSMLFGNRLMAFVGTFAYSIYLLHAPLIHLIWKYALRPLHLGGRADFLLLCAAGIPAIIAISFLFFLLCERPFLSSRRPIAQPVLEGAAS